MNDDSQRHPPAPPARPEADVRMRGFRRRATVAEARQWIDGRAAVGALGAEDLPLPELRGRVLAAAVRSGADVPGFDRAMMDGYALRADETRGASPYNPLRVDVVGQSLPGRPFDDLVRPGQAIRIMTGAPMPGGADAVLPAERCEEAGRQVRLLGEVPPGKHVGRRGEDVEQGCVVLPAMRVLRPQDLGVLSSIGAATAAVWRRPRVRILVTGDELLPAGTQPRGCLIADANGPMLAALAQRDGAVVVGDAPRRVADQPQAILEAMSEPADVVLVSGGSSVGQEDHAPILLARHGELAIHGVAVRPSSPAGMGALGNALVFLLPGNPVSCLCAYDFFAGRALRRLGGRGDQWPYPARRGVLTRKLVSQVGRTDYARVAWRSPGAEAGGFEPQDAAVEPLAVSGASMLTSTTRADGFVVVPPDSEGHAAGARVLVHCYDGQFG